MRFEAEPYCRKHVVTPDEGVDQAKTKNTRVRAILNRPKACKFCGIKGGRLKPDSSLPDSCLPTGYVT